MVRSCMRVFVEVMVASIVCPILWVGPDTCCSKKESRRRLMVEVSEKSILSRCILRSPRIYIYIYIYVVFCFRPDRGQRQVGVGIQM